MNARHGNPSNDFTTPHQARNPQAGYTNHARQPDANLIAPDRETLATVPKALLPTLEVGQTILVLGTRYRVDSVECVVHAADSVWWDVHLGLTP